MSPRPIAADVFGFLDESVRANAEFLLRKADVETSAGFVQFGMGEDLLPVIVVPLMPDEPDREDDKARGFQVKTALIPGLGETRGLMLKCLDSRLKGPFAYLADDVCVSLGSAPDRQAGIVCMEVLERWRSLFQLKGPETLSQSAQIGLISELHVLERALDVSTDAGTAWMGPDKGRNDFLAAHASIEVKATLSRDTFAVGIHGLRQLEVPDEGNPLWIFAEQLEPYPEGDSVESVVGRVLDKISDRVAFLTKLDSVGVRLEDLNRYESRYRTVRRRLIPVNDAFPRITPNTLSNIEHADHFTRVDYSIEIGAIPSPFPDEEALFRVGELFK